jgi:hypothetical protein
MPCVIPKFNGGCVKIKAMKIKLRLRYFIGKQAKMKSWLFDLYSVVSLGCVVHKSNNNKHAYAGTTE